jgi:hypothetical protein
VAHVAPPSVVAITAPLFPDAKQTVVEGQDTALRKGTAPFVASGITGPKLRVQLVPPFVVSAIVAGSVLPSMATHMVDEGQEMFSSCPNVCCGPVKFQLLPPFVVTRTVVPKSLLPEGKYPTARHIEAVGHDIP